MSRVRRLILMRLAVLAASILLRSALLRHTPATRIVYLAVLLAVAGWLIYSFARRRQ